MLISLRSIPCDRLYVLCYNFLIGKIIIVSWTTIFYVFLVDKWIRFLKLIFLYIFVTWSYKTYYKKYAFNNFCLT